MLDSVLELITQAASSSTFIFCFCNLIIVILLLDLKPRISVHQSEISLSICANQKQGTMSKCLAEKDTEVSHVNEAITEEKSEDNFEIEGGDDVDYWSEEEQEENGEEENDELRRRVEEFIEKVNKGWKEELLSRSSLVYEKKSNEILA